MSPDWSEDPDPIPYADLENPETLNLYAYEQNNPLNSSDPDGHSNEGCYTSSSQDSNGTVHVVVNCDPLDPQGNEAFVVAGALFMNEELGPVAWGALLLTVGCIQAHCGSAIANLFSKPSTPAPTVSPQVSTPKTPEPPNEPDPKNLTKNVRKIAQKLGKSVREINDAIHDVKRGMPRGGPVKNPDVLVDTETGEVYPQTPSGHGDSIGNINDHLQ